jgi:hypothetical protein
VEDIDKDGNNSLGNISHGRKNMGENKEGTALGRQKQMNGFSCYMSNIIRNVK